MKAVYVVRCDNPGDDNTYEQVAFATAEGAQQLADELQRDNDDYARKNNMDPFYTYHVDVWEVRP